MFNIIKPTLVSLLLLAVITFTSFGLRAQSKDQATLNFPTPKNINNLLFYLQRDPTINSIMYTLNLDEKGNVSKSNPLKIFWIRYAENGVIKELNYIQKKFAYGVDTKEIGTDKYELRFVSYKKLVLLLQRSPDKGYYVSTTINNKTFRLNRIFVRIDGGTFWVPNVKYAQLEGTDLASGKAVAERINVK